MPTISSAAWDDPEVARLTTEQQAELRARYDGAGESGRPPSASDVAVVLLARDDAGTPIGCGALRPLGDGEAELKRIYVVPAARRRGVSKLLLAGLEVEALSRGWTTRRLQTGPRQPEAVGLHTRAGYEPAAAFGHHGDDQDSLFLARGLT
ncbi:GNAT family N-acetyltransferase [Modestobacter marinus]|uniref:GNAT family N-acetyltransferase n=1 Tax=Modestobacter marinus TaxID=477641 RepID=UPI001C960E94|nr:GNAT family N-acetyltransferase [Modestobacter marinus]